ncbi:sirohydrochlorin chelatase [Heyndrickxia sp. MSNUG]|uniref:sirohydrochlorin chelatase n=1 Tax=Heyndrickxia sp. MSNUG TaxID=3136677 RepID=UPI003C2EF1B2
MKAAVYIGHGSRSDEGNKQFISFIEEVMAKTPMHVTAYGFLENAKPSVMEAVESCIWRGANEITVIPVLLLPGIHANVDIPEILKTVKEKHLDVDIRYGEPIGINSIMVEIIEDRLREKGFTGSLEEGILLVGHGSRDPLAAAEFEKLQVKLQDKTASAIHTAYITTSPFYAEKVSELMDSSLRTIYLLPYLLFTGGFAVKMKERTNEFSRHSSRYEVVVCEPVGFDDRLQALLVKKAEEAVSI